jgi:hypothetical protein
MDLNLQATPTVKSWYKKYATDLLHQVTSKVGEVFTPSTLNPEAHQEP